MGYSVTWFERKGLQIVADCLVVAPLVFQKKTPTAMRFGRIGFFPQDPPKLTDSLLRLARLSQRAAQIVMHNVIVRGHAQRVAEKRYPIFPILELVPSQDQAENAARNRCGGPADHLITRVAGQIVQAPD